MRFWREGVLLREVVWWSEDRWVGRARWECLGAGFAMKRVWGRGAVCVFWCGWRYGLFVGSVSGVIQAHLAATCASPYSYSVPYPSYLLPRLALHLYFSALLSLVSSCAPDGASLAGLWIESFLAACL